MRLLYVTDGKVDGYLVKALREAGHLVEATDQPADGVEMADGGDYQAIVLDWSGAPTQPAARIAKSTAALVVAIVTASGGVSRAAVLRAGADACFVRPVSFIELQARLDALARLVQRARPDAQAAEMQAAEMIEAEQAVRLNGRTVPLSRREFQMMAYLVGHAGEVIGLDRLHRQVWGEASEPRPEPVRACLSRLRRKLADAGADPVLHAVAGHGYMFRAAGGDAKVG